MREFQKQNGIKGKCLDNTQMVLNMKKRFRAKAVVVSNIKDFTITFTIHLVPLKRGKIYEPSYEFYILKNRKYFTSLRKVLKYHYRKCRKLSTYEEHRKKIISGFKEFKNYEERMNQGDFVVSDEKYYSELLRCFPKY